MNYIKAAFTAAWVVPLVVVRTFAGMAWCMILNGVDRLRRR